MINHQHEIEWRGNSVSIITQSTESNKLCHA